MERDREGYAGDHQDHEEVVALLRRGRDEILRDWVERVRDNITVQTGRDLEEPVLLDHMPHLFDSILDRLEYNRSRDDAVRLAAIHGANRRSDGYGVVETVTELFMFRRAIWVYLSTVDARRPRWSPPSSRSTGWSTARPSPASPPSWTRTPA
jgi:hypothetical protein